MPVDHPPPKSPPATDNVSVAAVLLNWNQGAVTADQAERLCRWNRPRLVIYVVDNGSTAEHHPALQDAARRCPSITILWNTENRGFAGGVNTALSAICGRDDMDAVLLLNLDATVEAETLDCLCRTLASDERIAATGPVLIEAHGGPGPPRACVGGRDPARFLHSRIPAAPGAPVPSLRDVDYVPGTVCLIRTAALRSVGRMDERFFFSGEIADWCRRARDAGHRCVVNGTARAEHHPDAPEERRETLYRYYTLRNRFLYVRKHGPAWRRLFWLAAGLLMWLRTRTTSRTAAQAIAWALRDGWNGDFGNRNDRFGYAAYRPPAETASGGWS